MGFWERILIFRQRLRWTIMIFHFLEMIFSSTDTLKWNDISLETFFVFCWFLSSQHIYINCSYNHISRFYMNNQSLRQPSSACSPCRGFDEIICSNCGPNSASRHNFITLGPTTHLNILSLISSEFHRIKLLWVRVTLWSM